MSQTDEKLEGNEGEPKGDVEKANDEGVEGNDGEKKTDQDVDVQIDEGMHLEFFFAVIL